MKKFSFGFALVGLVSALHGQMLEVTSSGVGIGTVSPQTRLEIASSASGSGVDGPAVRITNGAHGASSGAGNLIGSLDFYSLDPQVTGLKAQIQAIGDASSNWGPGGNSRTNLFFSGSDSGTQVSGMTLTYAGEVGIGTTVPQTKLEIASTISGSVGDGPAIRITNGAHGNSSGTGNLVGSVDFYSLDPQVTGLKAQITAIGDATGNWGPGGNSRTNLFLAGSDSGTQASGVIINYAGNVGIGTGSPGYKLEVNGSVRAASFVSNSTTYADFVFKPGYRLTPLADVEAAIRRDGHLPDIPSETEAKAHGIDLSAQQAKLLQKVEEMTLHLIEHEKALARLEAENAELRARLDFSQ